MSPVKSASIRLRRPGPPEPHLPEPDLDFSPGRCFEFRAVQSVRLREVDIHECNETHGKMESNRVSLMKSHTVPKKLLERFAFDDPVTHSKRLWRYQKGRAPYGRAAPKTATRRDGHFAEPANAAKEAQLEEQLERKFEHPVNQFIEVIGYRTFVLQPSHIKALTGYLTMLFTRSRAERAASQGHADVTIDALRSLLSDEQRLSELSAKHTMDLIDHGLAVRMVTREDVVAAIENTIAAHSDTDEAQRRYIQTVETMMEFSDVNMLNGDWNTIHAEPEKPFVIGDAPVVTWERTENNVLNFGQGFGRPNVEVLLPVSPTTCLHVLPRVARTRPVRMPATTEVNMAQAAFATEHCFANVLSREIDGILQPHFGTMRLGIDGFSVSHIDYRKVMFDILMGATALR